MSLAWSSLDARVHIKLGVVGHIKRRPAGRLVDFDGVIARARGNLSGPIGPRWLGTRARSSQWAVTGGRGTLMKQLSIIRIVCDTLKKIEILNRFFGEQALGWFAMWHVPADWINKCLPLIIDPAMNSRCDW